MAEVNYELLEKAAVHIHTLQQSAVLNHGIGEIAYETKKSDKTIYAELNPGNLITYLEVIKKYDDTRKKPSSLPKHGLLDFMICMIKTEDLSPLIAMNTFFNIACHKIPSKTVDPGKASDVISKITQVASTECSESINAVIGALSGDGKVDRKEANRVHNEVMEAINALYEVLACADIIRKKR